MLCTRVQSAISIHAPRERSDRFASRRFKERGISIHAPRERSDLKYYNKNGGQNISIHAPRERSDSTKRSILINVDDFNPRSS